jgi:hypothetical protein
VKVVKRGEHVHDVVYAELEERGWKVVYCAVPRCVFVLHLSEHISGHYFRLELFEVHFITHSEDRFAYCC